MKPKFLLQFIVYLWINSVCGSPASSSQLIKIDQLGYRPTDETVDVISNPTSGYNDTLAFTPGTVYQLRECISDAIVDS